MSTHHTPYQNPRHDLFLSTPTFQQHGHSGIPRFTFAADREADPTPREENSSFVEFSASNILDASHGINQIKPNAFQVLKPDCSGVDDEEDEVPTLETGTVGQFLRSSRHDSRNPSVVATKKYEVLPELSYDESEYMSFASRTRMMLGESYCKQAAPCSRLSRLDLSLRENSRFHSYLHHGSRSGSFKGALDSHRNNNHHLNSCQSLGKKNDIIVESVYGDHSPYKSSSAITDSLSVSNLQILSGDVVVAAVKLPQIILDLQKRQTSLIRTTYLVDAYEKQLKVLLKMNGISIRHISDGEGSVHGDYRSTTTTDEGSAALSTRGSPIHETTKFFNLEARVKNLRSGVKLIQMIQNNQVYKEIAQFSDLSNLDLLDRMKDRVVSPDDELHKISLSERLETVHKFEAKQICQEVLSDVLTKAFSIAAVRPDITSKHCELDSAAKLQPSSRNTLRATLNKTTLGSTAGHNEITHPDQLDKELKYIIDYKVKLESLQLDRETNLKTLIRDVDSETSHVIHKRNNELTHCLRDKEQLQYDIEKFKSEMIHVESKSYVLNQKVSLAKQRLRSNYSGPKDIFSQGLLDRRDKQEAVLSNLKTRLASQLDKTSYRTVTQLISSLKQKKTNLAHKLHNVRQLHFKTTVEHERNKIHIDWLKNRTGLLSDFKKEITSNPSLIPVEKSVIKPLYDERGQLKKKMTGLSESVFDDPSSLSRTSLRRMLSSKFQKEDDLTGGASHDTNRRLDFADLVVENSTVLERKPRNHCNMSPGNRGDVDDPLMDENEDDDETEIEEGDELSANFDADLLGLDSGPKMTNGTNVSSEMLLQGSSEFIDFTKAHVDSPLKRRFSPTSKMLSTNLRESPQTRFPKQRLGDFMDGQRLKITMHATFGRRSEMQDGHQGLGKRDDNPLSGRNYMSEKWKDELLTIRDESLEEFSPRGVILEGDDGQVKSVRNLQTIPEKEFHLDSLADLASNETEGRVDSEPNKGNRRIVGVGYNNGTNGTLEDEEFERCSLGSISEEKASCM